MYETGVTPLEEAVDVYSNWIDSCEEANSPAKLAAQHQQQLPPLDHSGVTLGELTVGGRNVGGMVQQAKRWKIQPEGTVMAGSQPTAVPTGNNKRKAVEGGSRRRAHGVGGGRLVGQSGSRRRGGRESLEISEEEDDEEEAGLSIEEDDEEEEEWPDDELDEETVGMTQPLVAAPDAQEIEVDELYDESALASKGDEEDEDEANEHHAGMTAAHEPENGGRLRLQPGAWDDDPDD